MALSPSPPKPGKVRFLQQGQEFGYWSAKGKDMPTKRSSVAGELVHVLLSFLPKHDLSPSCFLHPMSGDGFVIKNEPQYHNYSRIPSNRSSLAKDLFF